MKGSMHRITVLLIPALFVSASIACSSPPKKETPVVREAPKPRGPGYLGIKYSNALGGKRVILVRPHGPAARAGIRRGDLIVAVGGRNLNGREIGVLRRIVMAKKHGERLPLTLVRGSRMLRVTAIVEETPPGYYPGGLNRPGSRFRSSSPYRYGDPYSRRRPGY